MVSIAKVIIIYSILSSKVTIYIKEECKTNTYIVRFTTSTISKFPMKLLYMSNTKKLFFFIIIILKDVLSPDV